MSHRYAFSTKGVLRHLNWDLVRQYCHANSLFLDLNCLGQEEADIDALTDAIQALPPEKRTELEQDFHDVYDLADDDGMRVIYEEAKSRGEDLTAALTELEGPHDAAIWLLLNREALFSDLLRMRSADTLNKRYWRRRYIGRGLQADASQSAISQLSRALSDYLVKQEGRGMQCYVECLPRSTGLLFIAYPEDYGTTILEYQGDDLVRRPIRPTTDLLFYFDPERGVLDVFAQGSKRKIKDLQEIFGVVVLGVALPADGGPVIMYSLNRLKEPSFRFAVEAAFGLMEVEVKWVYVRDRDGGRGMTLEVGGPPGKGVIYAAQRYWSVEPGEQTDKYPFSQMDVERVKLQAHFRPISKRRRGRTKTFTIATNGCLLDHEGIDGLLRKVLALSGLEMQVPDDAAA